MARMLTYAKIGPKRYLFSCIDCQHEREITYSQLWNIKKEKSTGRCNRCNIITRDNANFLKKRIPWNKGKAYKPVRNYEKSIIAFKYIHLFSPTASKETREKQSKARKGKFAGKNHPNWKGGITKERVKAINSDKYKDWRLTVFERDCFTCQKCQTEGGSLEAHHMLFWHSHPDKRYEISNGITLCKQCHRNIHKGKGYGKENNI